MVKYVGFKVHKRGIPKPDGTRRTCLHCRRVATVSASKVVADKRMEVVYCNDHAKQAKELG